MRMTYVRLTKKHSLIQKMCHVWVDPKGAEFIGNKQTYRHSHRMYRGHLAF